MAETEFKYDVFISYSITDEVWGVDTLLPALENANFEGLYSLPRFSSRQTGSSNTQDAAENNRHTILVMTRDWISREWILYDGILARTNDPAVFNIRQFPYF